MVIGLNRHIQAGDTSQESEMSEITPSGKLPPQGVIIGAAVVLLGIVFGIVGTMLGLPSGLVAIGAFALFIIGAVLFVRGAFRQQS
jgi:hypothetical protein